MIRNQWIIYASRAININEEKRKKVLKKNKKKRKEAGRNGEK